MPFNTRIHWRVEGVLWVLKHPAHVDPEKKKRVRKEKERKKEKKKEKDRKKTDDSEKYLSPLPR